MSTLPQYGSPTDSDIVGSVVAQAGGRTTSSGAVQPATTSRPLNSANNDISDKEQPTKSASMSGVLVGVLLLLAAVIGGIVIWRRRGSGSPIDRALRDVSNAEARRWMIHKDKFLVVEQEDDSTVEVIVPDERIRQRYILAALTLIVSGEEPNRETSECTWPGVECEAEVVRRIALNSSHRSTTTSSSSASDKRVLPRELGTFLPALRELSLVGLELAGPIPSNMPETMSWLELSRNLLTGSIPSDIWTLPQLRFLFLDENHLTGSLTRNEPRVADQLRQVRIFQNQLTGTLPVWVLSSSEMVQVEHWIAYSNAFSGTLPSLDYPPKLSYLDMSSNDLRGTIPDSLWSVSTLETLYLEHNHLSGTIPAPLIPLPSLDKVFLHNNTFEGEIPTSLLTEWPVITELRLDQNNLEGTVPSAMWSHPTLQQLDLSFNQLRGTLPTTTAAPSSFTHVLLHHNLWQGTVPNNFGYAWDNLLELRLDGNDNLKGTLGPSSSDQCQQAWPNAGATDFVLTSDCRSLLVTDVPNIVCECCTFCA